MFSTRAIFDEWTGSDEAANTTKATALLIEVVYSIHCVGLSFGWSNNILKLFPRKVQHFEDSTKTNFTVYLSSEYRYV